MGLLPGLSGDLAAGKGMISWRVGEGSRAKWLGVVAPPAAVQGAAGGIARAAETLPKARLASGGGGKSGPWEVFSPALGFTGLTSEGWGVGASLNDYSPGFFSYPDYCVPSSDKSLLYPGWEILRGPPWAMDVNCSPPELVQHWEQPFFRWTMLQPDGGEGGHIEDFGSQPVSEPPVTWWPGQPNYGSVLRDAIAGELEGHPSRYPNLRYWYQFGTAPPDDYSLLNEYVPELRYDSVESYRADAADEITDNYSVASYSNRLTRGDVAIADSDPYSSLPRLSLGYLGSPLYGDDSAALDDDNLDEANYSYADDAQRMHGEARYANKVYGRVRDYPNGEKVLQYWLFYYYNPRGGPIDDHEGDWEMVQVRLGGDDQPLQATAAQHSGGERCDWQHVQTSGGRPIVYVAEGSHATYFSSGTHLQDAGAFFDSADGNGERLVPEVVNITQEPSWIGWGGKWGGTGRSPAGPAHGDNAGKYVDPLAWSDQVSGCTEEQTSRSAQVRAAVPPDSAPPLPRIETRRQGKQLIVTYRYSGKISRGALPTLLTSIDPKGSRYPPLTKRSELHRRTGQVRQPIGLGPAPYRLRVRVLGSDGRRSKTSLLKLQGQFLRAQR